MAYLPDRGIVSAIEPAPNTNPEEGLFAIVGAGADSARYRLCRNSIDHGVCNWAVREDEASPLCRSCSFNTVIPNLQAQDAVQAWASIEAAKRRLLYTLIQLRLPLEQRDAEGRGLAFAFMADEGDTRIFTGHCDGLVTINIAEADAPFREKIRLSLGEHYRTVLGHFRHEIGHYYWDRLVRGTRWLDPYRSVFGDETVDYASAMKEHYARGARSDWQNDFVSVYAASHPWEDWAETFAHYLHMEDTLETAGSYGLTIRPRSDSGAGLQDVAARRLQMDDFDDIVTAWFPVTLALNAFNRGLGLPDVYPFVLSPKTVEKLRFVHDLIRESWMPP